MEAKIMNWYRKETLMLLLLFALDAAATGLFVYAMMQGNCK